MATFAQYSFNFIVSIIMARLLAPEIFGLLAMATVFTSINNLFVDFGTRDAIVRQKEIDRGFLCSIFWFNIFIGLVVFLIMLLASRWIADFYGYPILQTIVCLMSVNILFSAMAIVPRGLLIREMNFRAFFWEASLIPPISGLIGIYLAWQGFGVWSLVTQQMIAVIGGSILVWILVGWFPNFTFQLFHIKQIFPYSSYLSVTKISNYFTKQGDLFLIGKFLGAASLGIYSKGYGILTKPLKMINGTILPVLFSAISKIQDEVDKLNEVYLQASKNMAILYFPLWVGSIFLAKPFVIVLLGQRWKDVIPLIPIFMTNLLFVSQSSIASHYLKALGETKKLFALTVITSIAIVISFAIGLNWGIGGVAVGYCLAVIFEYFLFTMFTIKLIKLSLLEIIINLKGVFLNALIMSLTIILAEMILFRLTLNPMEILQLLLPGVLGVGAYVYVSWITMPDARTLAKDLLPSKK